jgi:hypothetical protein
MLLPVPLDQWGLKLNNMPINEQAARKWVESLSPAEVSSLRTSAALIMTKLLAFNNPDTLTLEEKNILKKTNLVDAFRKPLPSSAGAICIDQTGKDITERIR